MPERASIFQVCQIGVEVTPGTGVAANKLLRSISIDPGVQSDVSLFRATGNKFPSVGSLNKEWIQAKLSGALTYTEIIYVLSSIMSYAAPVQQGATTAYKWTHTIDTDGPDTVKTFTVEQGSSVRAHKFDYGLVTALELMFSRSGIEVGGQMIGQTFTDGGAMTGGPSEIALVPVMPPQVNIQLATTAAGLAAATPLNRVISAGWSLSDRFGPLWALLRSAGYSFPATVETEPKQQIKLTVQADSEGMAFLTDLRDQDTGFIRIDAVGATIDAPYTYQFILDMAYKVGGLSEFKDEDGVFAVEWTLDAVHDATWGKSCQVEVTNAITAL